MKKFANNEGFTHIELIFIVVVLAIIVLAGLTVYQNKADKNYSLKIQSAYNQQAAQMKKLYDSFSLPVFASDNSNPSSDTKELATINQEISHATQLTNKLKDTNNIVLFPLITNAQARKQHKAVAQYIDDSTAFLQQYQELATYIKGLEAALNDYSKAAEAFTQLQTVQSLQALSNQLNNNPDLNFFKPLEELSQLTPPTDLRSAHQKLLSAYSNFQKDFGTLTRDVDSCQGGQSLIQAGDCPSVVPDLLNISGKDTAALELAFHYNDLADTSLQHNSLIHKQLVKLEAEKPLATN